MKSIVKAAVAAATLAVLPTSAHAANVMITSTGFDTPGHRTGSISYTPTATTLNNIGIGRFRLAGTDLSTMDPVTFFTYCVDIFHTLGSGVFTMPGLASYVTDGTKRAQLLTFVSNADPFIANATTTNARRDASAAVQLGVWEIVYEGSGAYNLGSGQFSVAGSNSATARSLANSWLGNVTANTWSAAPATEIGFLYNRTTQSQIYLNAVPEPSVWAMLLLGFGFVGGALRRTTRRRSMPVVFA